VVDHALALCVPHGLIVALITATFIDIDHLIIPDTVTLPAMAVGVLATGCWGACIWCRSGSGSAEFDCHRHLARDECH